MIGTVVNVRMPEEYQIVESPTSIGRHEANTVRLRGFAVSRFHAEIGRSENGKPYIEDMGSTYGTYVNGQKLEGRVTLHDGDEILLGVSGGFPDGEYAFKFREAQGPPPAEQKKQPRAPTRHTIREGRLQAEEAPHAYVYRLKGVFRRPECDGMASQVVGAVRAAPRDVVLELSAVDYMNSYGLGILVRMAQDVADESQTIVLAGAQGLVLRLFQTVGLDRRLSCFPTEKEALQALAARAPGPGT